MKRLFATFVSCIVLLSAAVTTPALAEVKDEAEQSNVGVFQDALTTAADGIQSVLNGVKTSIEGLCATSEQIVLENCESVEASEAVASQNVGNAAVIPSDVPGVIWSGPEEDLTCTLLSGYSFDGQALRNEIFAHQRLTTFIAEANTSLTGNASTLFRGCAALSRIELSASFDTSQVTNMSSMFFNCFALNSLTLPESFDTGLVTDMADMFGNCYGLATLKLPEAFITTNANMTRMFGSAENSGSLRSLTLPKDFTMKAGTGLPGLASQGSSKYYWTTSIDSCVNYGTTEDEAVANINNALAASADSVTFRKANVTLDFNSNGGTYATTTDAQQGSASNADEVKTLFGTTNEAIDAADAPAPKLAGFKCAGWSATRDGAVLPSPITFPAANATYYAVWTPVIAITFDTNGHASFTGDQKTLSIDCVSGEKLTLPAEDALTVEPSYIFNGWFTEVTGGTQVTDETDCPATATTYYAQYAEVPGPAPDVMPAGDTDTLPLTDDSSAARTGAVIAVLMGTVALLACGYSLTRKRLQ